jgi:hypothetical protein
VAGASIYVAAPSVTGATATFTNQLAAGSDYDFRITAVNSENTGLVSASYDENTFKAFFNPSVASLLTYVSATLANDNTPTIVLSWTDGNNGGDSGMTTTAQYSAAGAGNYLSATSVSTNTATF